MCMYPVDKCMKVCGQHVGESHHCNDWSRTHVAHQSAEERLISQVPVVLFKKVFRCLIYVCKKR